MNPGVPEVVQKQELKSLAKTYGKFWCTWQFDRGKYIFFNKFLGPFTDLLL